MWLVKIDIDLNVCKTFLIDDITRKKILTFENSLSKLYKNKNFFYDSINKENYKDNLFKRIEEIQTISKPIELREIKTLNQFGFLNVNLEKENQILSTLTNMFFDNKYGDKYYINENEYELKKESAESFIKELVKSIENQIEDLNLELKEYLELK